MAAIEYVKNVPGKTQAYGVERSPKCSIKAVVLIRVNCPARQSDLFRNHWGRSAPKG